MTDLLNHRRVGGGPLDQRRVRSGAGWLAEEPGVPEVVELIAATTRLEVDRALASGEIVVDGRGRYVTETDDAVRAAHRLNGVLTLTSAALHHGWEVKLAPAQPQVAVPRNRKVAKERREGVDLRWCDLHADDVDGIATGVEATLRLCLSQLPRDESQAIADSALRHGVTPATLRRAALSAAWTGGTPGAARGRRATGEAANPFESCLRDITYDVPGLAAGPQVTIRSTGWSARPDLVDADLEVVLEADSFEWHGDRAALARDARRYNLLVVEGWIVLRFAWEDVMFDRDYVLSVLVAAVELVQRRAGSPTCTCGAA